MSMMISAIKALGVSEFVCDSVGTKEMFDTTYKSLSEDNPKITWDQVNSKMTELQAEYDAKAYARNRALEYPPIADQQDMQFHDAIDGTTTWQDAIQAVKNKYPKPE